MLDMAMEKESKAKILRELIKKMQELMDMEGVSAEEPPEEMTEENPMEGIEEAMGGSPEMEQDGLAEEVKKPRPSAARMVVAEITKKPMTKPENPLNKKRGYRG
jgi:hypothetical protein